MLKFDCRVSKREVIKKNTIIQAKKYLGFRKRELKTFEDLYHNCFSLRSLIEDKKIDLQSIESSDFKYSLTRELRQNFGYLTKDKQVQFYKPYQTDYWTWRIMSIRQGNYFWDWSDFVSINTPKIELSSKFKPLLKFQNKQFKTLNEAKIHAYLTWDNLGFNLDMQTKRLNTYSWHILGTPLWIKKDMKHGGWRIYEGIEYNKYNHICSNKGTFFLCRTPDTCELNKKQFLQYVYNNIIDNDLQYLFDWMWK